MGNYKLRPENVVKSVDNLGRITLPKGLRDRMYINSDNSELEIFTLELDGETYICLKSPESMLNRLYAARDVFDELGVEVPDGLKNKIDELENSKR